MKTTTLQLITPTTSTTLELKGTAVIGGDGTRGLCIEGLDKGDYALINLNGNTVQVTPLRGSERKSRELVAGSPLFIGNLVVLIAEVVGDLRAEPVPSLRQLAAQMERFAQSSNWTESLNQLLANTLQIAEMQVGLVIARGKQNEFEIQASYGVQPEAAWMSETVIQQCLKSNEMVFVQNILGTGFENSHSLTFHKFLSFCCVPLSIDNVVFGVLFLTSKFPHPGLSEARCDEVACFAKLTALTLRNLLRESEYEARLQKLTSPALHDAFQTEDPRFLDQLAIAKQVSPTELSTLILGETGTGKEKLARWIHQQSERRDGPFIAINCGAIPAELLESLLFGHKRGSFTGAHADQVGKFEQAQNGTIFLDEVAELPLALQVKLLRVLQEKLVDPVGARKPVPVHVRVLAATHRNLHEMMREGLFREDLFYRLGEVSLLIPPLRERPRDIGLLAYEMLKELAPQKTLSTESVTWLENQEWTGNVRELSSAIKRAALLGVSPEILPGDFMRGHAMPTYSRPLVDNGEENLKSAKETIVIERIRKALVQSRGHRKKAADLLGVTTRTLFRYLDQYKDELTDLSLKGDKDVTR